MKKVKPRWQILRESGPTSISEVLELLLQNRRFTPSFLNATLKDLEQHLAISGIRAGAELMVWHLERVHKVVLVGDYDCDGITSAAQAALFLRDIGYTNFAVVIPTRAEGYGMPARAVQRHPDARLFLIMDCGTFDVEPIALARSGGADCIVIDHHEVANHAAEELAPASILINPKQPGCPSTFKEFCSSGLTLLFLSQLRKASQSRLRHQSWPALGAKYLALAALGTVADIVPLLEGNRIITRAGLGHINRGAFMPVQEIVELAGLQNQDLSAGHIGYYIAPRINAAGRIADPALAYEFLVADDPGACRERARELNLLNSRRQHQEYLILKTVRDRFTSEMNERRTLVMGDPQWSTGLVGIIASRVQQELFYGPTIMLSMDPERCVARGSARSIPGFDIHAALNQCGDLLMRWGGHRMAAGMTLSLDKMEAFAERFEQVAQTHDAGIFIPKGKVDLELDLDLVTSDLLDALKQLEPHGQGNPTPLFCTRQVKVGVQRVFGRDREHLRVLLNDGIGGIIWRGAALYPSARTLQSERHDVVFQVERDRFQGGPVLNIKDLGQLFK
jgi:single-stranded-DNA-specific exonuclease